MFIIYLIIGIIIIGVIIYFITKPLKNIIILSDLYNKVYIKSNIINYNDIILQINLNNNLEMILDKDVIIIEEDNKIIIKSNNILKYKGSLEINTIKIIDVLGYLKDSNDQTILDRFNILNNLDISINEVIIKNKEMFIKKLFTSSIILTYDLQININIFKTDLGYFSSDNNFISRFKFINNITDDIQDLHVSIPDTTKVPSTVILSIDSNDKKYIGTTTLQYYEQIDIGKYNGNLGDIIIRSSELSRITSYFLREVNRINNTKLSFAEVHFTLNNDYKDSFMYVPYNNIPYKGELQLIYNLIIQ